MDQKPKKPSENIAVAGSSKEINNMAFGYRHPQWECRKQLTSHRLPLRAGVGPTSLCQLHRVRVASIAEAARSEGCHPKATDSGPQ